MSASPSIKYKRISRICAKIIELLNGEEEGDVEEFLGNIQRVFLLLCECFHTDIESAEAEGPSEDSSSCAHSYVEEMYQHLNHAISRAKTSLAYEGRWMELFDKGEDASDIFPMFANPRIFTGNTFEDCKNSAEEEDMYLSPPDSEPMSADDKEILSKARELQGKL